MEMVNGYACANCAEAAMAARGIDPVQPLRQSRAEVDAAAAAAAPPPPPLRAEVAGAGLRLDVQV